MAKMQKNLKEKLHAFCTNLCRQMIKILITGASCALLCFITFNGDDAITGNAISVTNVPSEFGMSLGLKDIFSLVLVMAFVCLLIYANCRYNQSIGHTSKKARNNSKMHKIRR